MSAVSSCSCSCRHTPSLMHPSVFCKGALFSRKALHVFFSSSFFVPRCLLDEHTNSVKFTTSGTIHLSNIADERTWRNAKLNQMCTQAWNVPVGVKFHFGFQSQATLSESCAKEGTIDCKFSRDDEEILQKAIVYEAEHGFPNCVGRTKRFSEFLASKLSALSNANSSHLDTTQASLSNLTQRYDKMGVHDRVAVLDKVCALLGFKCVQDLLDQHVALTEASKDLQVSTNLLEHNITSNTTLMLQKICHPAIVFGSSERIELFNFTDKQKVAAVAVPSALCDVAGEDSLHLTSQALLNEEEVKRKGSVSLQNERGPTSQGKKAKKTVKKLKAGNAYEDWLLNKPISLMESLSPTLCSQLEDNGFHTLRKLLQHYPRNYLSFLQAGPNVEDGQFLTFSGKIVSCRVYSAHNLGILEVLIASVRGQASDVPVLQEKRSASEGNSTVTLHIKKFFRGARYSSKWFLNKLAEKYPLGTYAAVSGKVKAMEQENHFELKDYNLELLDSRKRDTKPERVYPVYPSKGGLDAKFLELCIQKVLPELPLNIDPLPKKYKTDYGLMDLHEAYVGIHSPQSLAVAEKARQRFVFDEFLYLQLGLLLQKQELSTNRHGIEADVEGLEVQPEFGKLPIEKWAPLTSKMLECLPYKLTDSQLNSVSEIMWDLQKPVSMRRLLQGDVGCGKTIVAFLALLEVIDAGFQGVIMEPTEFLAKQQYERFVEFLKHLDEKSRPRIALLTSSVAPIKARAIRMGLQSGEIQLAVGTHSLIANSVNFASLGLAIIDEQHRFGVEQRIRLQNKGSVMLSGQDISGREEGPAVLTRRSPHVLAMTATPIPRTLAFALYGDMDLSQITELPHGRIPVKTIVMIGGEEGLASAFEMVREELQGGGRVFIVYAIINESEDLPNLKAATAEYERIVKELEGYTCGLVHGKLKTTEKDAAMSAFKSGLTQVLVATTVVEVGIDIPEASMMVVVNAERYGIAQLHQLRGRVGRGTRESTCVLLASSESSLERLKALERSNDGFYLAEVDLQHRGPGDMLGRKQSGHLAEFSLARLNEDGEWMVQARKAAEDILKDHRGLEGLPHLKQELSFRQGPDSVRA